MKYKRSISILVVFITILSLGAASIGVFSGQGQSADDKQFTTLYGETVTLYGKGIYHNDSISLASQGISQDVVTLVLGVPLLMIALVWARKGSLKGILMLTGTIGYFLYSYISYSFLCMYNSLFLVYVMLMSASLFAFVMSMMSIDLEALRRSFDQKLPVKFIGGFQFFIAFTLLMMWLGKVVPTIANGIVPVGLEHYTTLVIQAMDLGIIVPVAVLSGILLMKKRVWGYLLSSIVIIKGLTMLTALTAMIIGQILAGVEVSLAIIIIFPVFNLLAIYCLVLILKNINEKTYINNVRNYSV